MVKPMEERFPIYSVYDKIIINGWTFDAELWLHHKFGLASALQGGRVVYFHLRQGGETVGLYEDSKWVIKIPQENDEACIAMTYFLTKHNRQRNKKEEKEKFANVHNM